jgi:putative hemolysin
MSLDNSFSLITSWCQTPEEVKEAQRLRYRVFVEEMGAKIPLHEAGVDADEFDPWCQHLIVRSKQNGDVIGTYRVLTPENATKLGRIYTDSEFDLHAFDALRPTMIEVGRSCVHPDYRSGSSIMALWRGLGQFMQAHGYESLLGCASVRMDDDGAYAHSLYCQFEKDGILSDDFRATPHKSLDTTRLTPTPGAKPPPLLKGYLRLGATICGRPAVDPQFNTADFLTLLRLENLNPRYAKHFLGND